MRLWVIEMTNGFNDAPKPSGAAHIPPAALGAGCSANRLRLYASQFEDQHAPQNLTLTLREAADEIDRLQEALRMLLPWRDFIDMHNPELGGLVFACSNARISLGEKA